MIDITLLTRLPELCARHYRVCAPPTALCRFRCLVGVKARGLTLDKGQYYAVLEGVVGRVQDVDDPVVDAAVETLRRLHQAEPAR